MEVDELLDEALGPEPRVSPAVPIVAIGLLFLLTAWIIFVLVYRAG